MAFREKSEWITVFALLGVYGFYFAGVLEGHGGSTAARLVGAVLAVVAIHIVLEIAVAILAPRDADAPADEREKQFALRGLRSGYWVFAIGTVGAMMAALAGYADAELANILLLTLVGAELARAATVIAQYRLGA